MKNLCLPILGLCLFFSCQKDTDLVNLSFPGVDPALWPYFQQFEIAANDRGILIDLNQAGISGEISDLPGQSVAGQCQFGHYINNHITIDQNYWNRSSTIDREFVVFHELGHCFLLRGHLEDSFNNGSCVSIMRSGLGTCIDAYSTLNRTYYLDELFNGRD